MKLRCGEPGGNSPVSHPSDFATVVRRGCDYLMLFDLNLQIRVDHLPQVAALALIFHPEAG